MRIKSINKKRFYKHKKSHYVPLIQRISREKKNTKKQIYHYDETKMRVSWLILQTMPKNSWTMAGQIKDKATDPNPFMKAS